MVSGSSDVGTAAPVQVREGEIVRREVVGDAYVDRARVEGGDFSAALDAFVTDHCWGAVWTRSGLSRQMRSVITLSVLAALRCSEEIQTHVRGAIRNGLSPAEVAEVFIHVGSYAGVPSAVEAFRAARSVIDGSTEGPGGGPTYVDDET